MASSIRVDWRSRGTRSLQHPAIEPDDRANEAEKSEPGRGREVFGYDTDRCVLREGDNQPRIDHAPDALADDEARRDQRSKTLTALRIRRRRAHALVIPVRD